MSVRHARKAAHACTAPCTLVPAHSPALAPPAQAQQRLGHWFVWTTIAKPFGLHMYLDITDPQQVGLAMRRCHEHTFAAAAQPVATPFPCLPTYLIPRWKRAAQSLEPLIRSCSAPIVSPRIPSALGGDLTRSRCPHTLHSTGAPPPAARPPLRPSLMCPSRVQLTRLHTRTHTYIQTHTLPAARYLTGCGPHGGQGILAREGSKQEGGELAGAHRVVLGTHHAPACVGGERREGSMGGCSQSSTPWSRLLSSPPTQAVWRSACAGCVRACVWLTRWHMEGCTQGPVGSATPPLALPMPTSQRSHPIA